MSFLDELRRTLENGGSVTCGEPMKYHTTFRVGGPAQYFITVTATEELCAVLRLCAENGISVTILGNGSNVLISDSGINGAVIKLAGAFEKITITEHADGTGARVYAGAGVMLSALAMKVAKSGLGGLEFAAGIPGCVGGAVVMNAGAYGGEIRDAITGADYVRLDGTTGHFSAEELQLSYRHSIFSEMPAVVCGAEFSFLKGNSEEALAKIAELGAKRREKQPLEFPSAGSTFKRPEGYFAGKLIMDSGLAGKQIGGARVSEKHCGFIINAGGATAADIYTLIRFVKERVMEETGVCLEPEVRMLGEFFGNRE